MNLYNMFAFKLNTIPESRSVLRNKVQMFQLSWSSFILLKEKLKTTSYPKFDVFMKSAK